MNPSSVNETPVLPDDEDDDGLGTRRDGLTRTTRLRLALARRHVGRRPSDRALAGRLPTFPSGATSPALYKCEPGTAPSLPGTETGRPQAIHRREGSSTPAPEIDGGAGPSEQVG